MDAYDLLRRALDHAARLGFALALLVAAPSVLAGATLHWTAPGDDGSIGTATRYDIRRSTQPLTAASFAAADTVAGIRPPAPAGAPESLSVALPQVGVTYSFAIKTVDDAGNWSGISNIATITAPTLRVRDDPFAGALLSPPAPNPAHDRTTMRLEAPSGTPLTLDVYDPSGRLVSRIARRESPGILDVTWDLRDAGGRRVAPGIYLVCARFGTSMHARRVTVTR